jgi:dUTP pyrophosphatase
MKNEEVLKQIQDQFDKIKSISGVEPDLEYAMELEKFLESDLKEMTEQMTDFFHQKTIHIEKLNPSIEDLSYAYETDSGFDLKSTIDVDILPHGRSLIPTGIKVSFDLGYELQIRPKSGLALKYGLTVLNTPGTIDQGYTGEICVIVFNTNPHIVSINKGMKIAQAVLCPVVNGKHVRFNYVESIENKDRSDNGFGSTGI